MSINNKSAIFSMMLFTSLLAFSNVNKDMTFDYPIKPGTKEWSKYNSTLERIKLLQIPNSELKELSTEFLLNICLDYPYLPEVCLDDNYQENYNIITSQFNGFQELINRSDFFDVLLKKNGELMKMAPDMKNKESSDRFDYSFQCFIVEFMMTQKPIVNSYIYSGRLLEIYNNNRIVRQENKDVFWWINDIPSEILESISQGYQSNTSGSYSAVTIMTPNGSTVSDTYSWVGSDLVSSDPEYISHMQILSNHPNATLNDYPSKKYNCHGYAWHVSEGGSKVWIGLSTETAEDIYWQDESYIQVPEAIGEKVSYYGNHSAIRLSSSLYKSKWGAGVLATHSPNDVPSIYLNGSTTKKFYVRRPYTSFTGPTLVTSNGTYTITNLSNGYTVEWALSDSYYNSNCLQANYPSANQCVITASSSHQMVNGTLTATIKKSGYTVTTLTKSVSAYTGFYGTYYNGKTTKQVNLPYPLYVLPSTYVVINSPNLIGATLSYQGSATPSALQYFSTIGMLRFGMPSNVGATLVITVTSNGDTYYLPVIVASNVYGLSVSVSSGLLNVSLVRDETDDFYKKSQLSLLETMSWRIEVYNASTGKKVYSQNKFSLSNYIQTTGWKPGVYIVCAIIGEDVFNEKVVIK